MKFYKLRVTQNAASVASAFNESFKPEIIPDLSDPYSVDWITEANEEVLVGEKVWQPSLFPPLPVSFRSDREIDMLADRCVVAISRRCYWLIPIKWGTSLDGHCTAVTSTRATIPPIRSS